MGWDTTDKVGGCNWVFLWLFSTDEKNLAVL